MKSSRFWMLVGLLWALPALASEVSVQLIPQGDLQVPEMRITAVPTNTPSTSPLDLHLAGGELRGVMDLTETQTWTLRAEGPGVWALEGTEIRPGEVDQVSLRLWPAGRLEGSLVGPDGNQVPESLRLYFRRSDEKASASIPKGESACTVARGDDSVESTFTCPLPAGRWNLILKADSFTPVHSWGVAVEADGTAHLGELSLRRGASMMGKVVTHDGPADPERAEVRISPAGASDSPLRTTINEWGYFVVQGLSQGSYSVVASQPGLAPARAYPIKVVADRHTQIVDPLELHPPVRLRAHLEPPVGPNDQPWTLTVGRVNPNTTAQETVARGTSDPAGHWVSEPLPTGEYRLIVTDSQGNRYYVEENLSLQTGASPVWIEIPLTAVSGRVVIGDTSVSDATVYFGGRSGVRRVEANTNDRGEFALVVPRDGTWTVDVIGGEPAVEARKMEVEVEGPVDEVLIELPDTLLTGSVTTPDGQPVNDASVRAINSEAGFMVGLHTDRRGEFEVRGLKIGNYHLAAHRGDERSGQVAHVIEEDRSQPLTLVLRATQTVEGRLVANGNGIAGAVVMAFVHQADSSGISQTPVQANTDNSGAFILRIPHSAPALTIAALPVGHGFTVQTVGVESPLVLEAEPAEGTVTLPSPGITASGRVSLLEVNGEMVDPNLLQAWAVLHGRQGEGDLLTAPAMPSGVYRLCEITLQEAALVLSGRARPVRCQEKYLSAGGDVVFDSPGGKG